MNVVTAEVKILTQHLAEAAQRQIIGIAHGAVILAIAMMLTASQPPNPTNCPGNSAPTIAYPIIWTGPSTSYTAATPPAEAAWKHGLGCG